MSRIRLWSFTVVAFLAPFVLSPPNVGAADWETYRGDNHRSGAAAETLETPLVEVWSDKSPAAPQPAWAGPEQRVIEGKDLRHRVRFDDAFQVAVAGDRLFFGSTVDHQLHCLDARSGKELWSFFTGGPVRLAPTVASGRVLFGSDDGYVYCLKADSGKLVWKLRAGPEEEWILARGEMTSRWPVRTGVLVEEGVAYFGAGIFPSENVYLYAVESATGKVLWKRDNISQDSAGRNDLSPQGYLLSEGNRLFVPSGRSLPAAFDKTDGTLLHKRTHGWRNAAGGVVGGSKAVLADGQILAGGDHHFLAMSQDEGDVGYGYFEGRQVAILGDAAYLATEKELRRVVRKEYAKATRVRHDLEAKIYGLSRSLRSAKGDAAEKIRAELGSLRAKLNETLDDGIVWNVPAKAEAQVIATPNLVFAGSEGIVTAFDVKDGKAVWKAAVEGEARGLAVANGHLYVSTTSGNIYAFATDPPEAPIAQRELVKNPYPEDDLTPVYQQAAEQILKRSKTRRGFCLVLGSETGRLAYEIAMRSDLEIYGLEPDARKVAASRRLLDSTGLYGNRITIHHAPLSEIPYSSYFANLVVSDSLIANGTIPFRAADVARHIKPLGGIVCLGRPGGSPEAAKAWLADLGIDEQTESSVEGGYVMLTRGALPGAANWSHQYGDAGNTAASEDRRVRGGLGVLWFGDPGPGKMVNRHEGAVGPLSVNGRLFVQGEDRVMAYDAYNGLFLWEYENPEAIRTGVFQNQNPGNLVAGDDALFVMVRGDCLKLDAATGKLLATYKIPKLGDDVPREWGFLAYKNGVLVGTATVREELEARLRRRGRVTKDFTDVIFAVDTKTDKPLWTHRGKSIAHHTVALGDDRVFFIDSTITSQQRAELLRQDKSELKKLTGEDARRAEERMKRLDARTAVALDLRSGKEAWSKAVDVTDCSDIGTGGGKLTLMHHNNVLMLCGANANGHYWRQFLAGEFKRRRLVALSAENGERLWAKDANYRHRPIIVEDQVLAEPWSFDLYTGAQRMREHPLTGKLEPWSIMRSGHHCGMISAAPNMLMFRSGFTSFYDLESDAGTSHFAGHRTGCWINMIPANGLVMIPEASAGCVCLFSIASTIVMEPREERTPWAIYSAVGSLTPVEHMTLNLGAPGDRRDQNARIWLAYPRPRPSRTTGLDLSLDLNHKFAGGGRFESLNSDAVDVEGHPEEWLFTSTGSGLTQVTLPLLGKGDKPGRYRVRLYFAELDKSVAPGERVFDVRVQGEAAVEGLDVVAEAGGARKALVKEVGAFDVTDSLQIELVPSGGKEKPPILSAIEVRRVDDAGDAAKD